MIPEGDYLDRKSRMDYLREKVKAEAHMADFDAMPQRLRVVRTAAGTRHNTMVCYNAGCRTFEDAERAVAGVWDGR